MGNDGGSIPKRRELVKEAARNPTITELKESRHEQQEYFWTTDPLSRKQLARPVVSDSSGKLYNKDSILEYLLPSDDVVGNSINKAEADKVLMGAVKNVKDVVEVKFEVEVDEGQKSGTRQEKWVCPITNRTLGAGVKAVYLVPCGHVFSEAAIKEIAEEKCLQCNESFAANDVIPILPTSADDISRLSLRMKTLKEKGLTHSLKKAPGGGKKRKKDTPKSDTNGEEEQPSGVKGINEAPISNTSTNETGNIKNAALASITSKVLKSEEARSKRRKVQTSENLKSLFTSSAERGSKSGYKNDFMSRGYAMGTHDKR
ncbi:Rtf2 RING-finger-domain-containing protein [Lineolata rhizophorae]|uniref:Rtf2 RING-finger-domain-containing protein n=1 Tax=Lineolata rhizophorae TaxID=578093 RepID=A0A6A6P1J2_9PEZI|nr:Rtf2 RING-finger-domain-containing protein [Lineolata rhizophorae]